MNTKPNNPTAFPHHETTSSGEPYHDHLGVTLRDYFSAAALNGLLSNPHATQTLLMQKGNDPTKSAKEIIEQSWAAADAMLAEREKGQS